MQQILSSLPSLPPLQSESLLQSCDAIGHFRPISGGHVFAGSEPPLLLVSLNSNSKQKLINT